MVKTTAKTQEKTVKNPVGNGGSFAVIETGGKQYKISSGAKINVEKLPGVYKQGDKIIFDKVLLSDDGKKTVVGTPYIKDAKVEAIFEENGRAKKLIVLKFKSKSNYSKKNGHRQPYTKVEGKKIKTKN